ncbi:SAM-dependent methyltransferase [Aliidiomarina iranensis]|uniref:SAM-dependent methyltransferase n=1 Tax=Aliidiomarina iranensis TaxID=1434071 RepID=A0A432W393_9GAMM|nr:SAM-dependent methyltransferase [Aliidiomarina iranensis]
MWDERYSREDYAYGTEPNDFLKQAVAKIDIQPGSRVLCLAEGEGRNAVFLAESGFIPLAVDYSNVALEKANRLAAARKVIIETRKIDLTKEDLPDEQFDLIVMIFCHLPSAPSIKLYEQIKKHLKSNGWLLLEGYTEAQLARNTGGPKDADLMFSSKELNDHFAEFNIVRSQELVRPIIEGTFHTGEGAVCQFIAQK